MKRHSQLNCLFLSASFAFQMTIATNRPLYEEEWFHGVLPREEVVRLLRHDGDFLVRETTRNDESQTVLSVCWNGHKHFIVQITAEVCDDAIDFIFSDENFYFLLSHFPGSLSLRRAELSKYSRIDSAPVPVRNTGHRSKWRYIKETSIKRTMGAQQ